ncbi:hypothetical protein, partial [Paenibacillus odorifer]|uniref:hypothetical protein n=1 Tax=Paenibacillus odorifer TaxID=189426 RepID=UPI001C4B29DB
MVICRPIPANHIHPSSMPPNYIAPSSDTTESCSSTVRYRRITFTHRPIPPNHVHPLKLSDSNDVIRKYIAFGARFRTPVQLFI